MKIITAAVISGLATLPQLVTPFNIKTNTERKCAYAFSTKYASSSPTLATAPTTPTSLHVSTSESAKVAPVSSSTATGVKVDASVETDATTTTARRKKKKVKRKPNEDINFLIKRTNQIISHSFRSSDNADNDSDNDNANAEQNVTLRTIHWLMDAWTQKVHPTAPEHSLALYNSMKEYGLEPSSKTLTKVVLAYAKCGRGGRAAKNILEEITGTGTDASARSGPKANVFSYTAVMEAYANADMVTVKDATEAEELMEWMIQETQSGNASMKPNAKSFLALIRTWGSVEVDDMEFGAKKAEYWMKRMRALVEEGVIDDVPNVFHYNSILNAWANSGEKGCAEKTEALLFQLEKSISTDAGDGSGSLLDGVLPNTVSYNVCIDAYAKDGNGQQAEALLNRMDEFYQTRKNRDCMPNTRSYNTVMNAYAKSLEQNAASKAETILRKMERLYKESDESDIRIKPDFISYATVINAWGRSFEYEKANKVLSLYREMLESYRKGDKSLRPNVVIFNSIMNACAYTMGEGTEQMQAMEIANVVLKELEESSYAKADQITYGTFLKVCQNQMPQSETRRQLVDIVFKKCAKDGQMGQLVLDQMKTIATHSQYDRLFGDSAGIMNWMDLPEDWTRNVVDGKRYRRQKLL